MFEWQDFDSPDKNGHAHAISSLVLHTETFHSNRAVCKLKGLLFFDPQDVQSSAPRKDFPPHTPADSVSLAVDVGFIAGIDQKNGVERFQTHSNGKEMWDQSILLGTNDRRPPTVPLADLQSNLEISRLTPVGSSTVQSLGLFRERAARDGNDVPGVRRLSFNGGGFFGPDGDQSPQALNAAATPSVYRHAEEERRARERETIGRLRER